MKVADFLKARHREIALLLDGAEIKKLLAFKSISDKCKNENLKGLMVNDGYFGYCDSFRVFAVEGVSQLPLSMCVRYSEEVTSLLGVANSVAVMTNEDLAICVKGEVHLYQPIGKGAPLTTIIEGCAKYGSFQYACNDFYNKSKDVVWKCLLRAFDMDKRRAVFHFSRDGMTVSMEINKESQLKENWDIRYNGEDIVMHLNPNYMDLWFKNVKERMCEVRIHSRFSPISFKYEGMHYVVMPIAYKEEEGKC